MTINALSAEIARLRMELRRLPEPDTVNHPSVAQYNAIATRIADLQDEIAAIRREEAAFFYRQRLA